MGLASAREAKAASEWARPWWDQPVRQTAAAVTGPNPVSCSRGRGFADFDRVGAPGAVDLELCAESGVAFGQPDCHGAGNGQGHRFFPATPAGDVGGLGSGQGFGRVQAEVVDPEQRGQRVRAPVAFGGHGVPYGDQDPQCRAHSLVEPWLAQLLLIQGQRTAAANRCASSGSHLPTRDGHPCGWLRRSGPVVGKAQVAASSPVLAVMMA